MPSKQRPESLLTSKSLALSLSAPRSPPHGTAHRALLAGADSADLPWTRHHNGDDIEDANNSNKKNESRGLHRRIVDFLQKTSVLQQKNRARRHPHLPMDPELPEHITRFLGVWLPLSWQNWLRDSGNLRAFADTCMTYSAQPAFALTSPQMLVNFRTLSQRCKTLRYGPHPMQIIDLFFPKTKRKPRGLVFFVHGGAWGCGSPWLYRLVASPFLDMGMAVAEVGYRTYPCGNVRTQCSDLELASFELVQHYPELCLEPTELGVVVMGHSSGAHITLLMVSEWTRRKMTSLERKITEERGGREFSPAALVNPGMRVDAYVGISGPYNISHHFDYEASRGLEEISPLKPANGDTREEFRKLSPALQIVECMSEWSSECETRALDNILPRMLLMHGIEDDIVPFTSTAEAASLLQSCGVTKLDEVYLARTRHNDCVMQLMVGGQVKDILVDWLENVPKGGHPQPAKRVLMQSRL